MPALIEVKYFNTFWLKKIVDDGKQWGDRGAAVNQGGQTPNDQTSFQPIWPGSDPAGANVCGTNTNLAGFGLGFYPTPDNQDGEAQKARCWYVEESRIRGGYNNASVDLGVKAYITEDMPNSFTRSSSMIYSGVFNSKTNTNETNQFPTGTEITKTADPHYGSLQKLYADDGNLLLFQENKVSRALIDKDLIYSAEGQPMSTQSNVVIGQITPYVGEYGIGKNPESFAVFGFRKYFIDKYRGCILRLSRDGMTEISSYGMNDYFRDKLAAIPDNKVNFTLSCVSLSSGTGINSIDITSTEGPQIGSIISIGSPAISISGNYVVSVLKLSANSYRVFCTKGVDIGVNDTIRFSNSATPKLPGGWDIHNRSYVVSLQQSSNYFSNRADGTNNKPFDLNTVNFDDAINGWVSFFTYNPTFMGSLKDTYYSFIDGDIYKHYATGVNTPSTNHQNFYNLYKDASISFIFNPDPSISKNFLTVSYEGSNGWEADIIKSDYQEYQTAPSASTTWDQNWPNNLNGNWQRYKDSARLIRSSTMGGYYEDPSVLKYSGFNRKENKYVANLVNDSEIRPQEVLFGPQGLINNTNNQTSGIKGYVANVTFSTDADTQPGGIKELFSVGSVYQISSK